MKDCDLEIRLAVEFEAEFFARHPLLRERLDQATGQDIHDLFDQVTGKLGTRRTLARYLAEGNLRGLDFERSYVMVQISSHFRCVVYFFPARFRTIVWARFADLVSDAMTEAGMVPPKRGGLTMDALPARNKLTRLQSDALLSLSEQLLQFERRFSVQGS